MSIAPPLPPAEPFALDSLITPTTPGIASRILGKTDGGSMTLFAFNQSQGLAQHQSPFDAFVMVLDGALTLTIGGISRSGDARHDRPPARERPARGGRAGEEPDALDLAEVARTRPCGSAGTAVGCQLLVRDMLFSLRVGSIQLLLT